MKTNLLLDLVRGVTPGSRSADGAEKPRKSLEQPRLGRDLSRSRLKKHRLEETPLQYAVTTVARLAVSPYQAIDGESPALRPVDEDSLDDYVCAILGMKHDEDKINPDLAPYLEELSKNESMFWAQPVTQSSFTMLCILHMADQAPGSAYGQFGRDTFMGWLNRKLPSTKVRCDYIPETYFDAVRVSRQPKTGFTIRCVVRYGRDSARSVEVRPMRRANLQYADLRGADLQGADLRDDNLQGTNLRDANLQRAHLQGADLRDADLRDADLRGANLRGADLQGANLQGANLQGANLEGANLQDAKLHGADLKDASLGGAKLQDADLSVTPKRVDRR